MNEGKHNGLSSDPKRNKKYTSFLQSCRNNEITVAKIAHFGAALMRKEKVHPHFFSDHSLLAGSLYLTLFSLGLPYNTKCLKRSAKPSLAVKVTANEAAKILALFERRIAERKPVEYITQESYYLGNKFYVNENVLVPRSLMKTQFNDFLNKVKWENYRVLDLCTGSGCIGITLALLNPKIKVDLVDISAKALEVALVNVKNYSLEERVHCIQSDLFKNIQEKYDLIITNPPYVPEREYKLQPAEVKNEPEVALNAGVEGLDIVNRILGQSKTHLNPNGLLIAEVGYSPAIYLKKKYRSVPFQWLICRASLEKESIIETLIRWTGLLDSIFICEAKGLPDHLL